MKEIIICAAVRASNGYVVRGHRHADALRTLQGRPGFEDERPWGADQGFITSDNRYVNRKEAMKIQKNAGIESVNPTGYLDDELYSEDLY